ncbi:hypothetical protein ACCS54_35105 [Rhizobium johnstonii]|uniref:Transmembrane protein n=1 Tax=Rhizobium johnstonii (strain DSM 114642 / LMG 32736 / 3841) TaxID=216596 RepID=Q1MJT3_RHIJ3|nr:MULTISPECIES: hypothetical protein [Rhizobium]MBY5372880.1 hypothetical protein [Rhizobium leguminosarum]MBY5387870.1 hypothetical protein [Rhizobium leguminosarum]MBY5428464.1 hypothetical protein [Rhizobium leguminosarum]NEH42686.1 hypothetical protein [Rhizobium leguminosarum]NEH98278.1 hypothetical protein [Rhizobium leguminosarum]
MFAGRYLWWMLMGIGIFMFAALSLDYITWLTIQLSGCGDMAGACEPTLRLISSVLKPACIWTAIGMLFMTTLLRLHTLSLIWFWGPVVAAWFVASMPILLFLAADAAALTRPATLAALPVALLFLVAFIAYLMLALEESDTLPLAASVPLRFTLRLTAVYGALAGAAFMPELSRVGGTLLDMPALSVLIAVAQPYLQTALTLGTGSMAPAYAVLAAFIAALAASLLPHAAPQPSRSAIMLRRLRR